jgi:hypothetical protein
MNLFTGSAALFAHSALASALSLNRRTLSFIHDQ